MNEHVVHQMNNPFVTSAKATLHCLTGCVIGEVAGFMIGVSGLAKDNLGYNVGLFIWFYTWTSASHEGPK